MNDWTIGYFRAIFEPLAKPFANPKLPMSGTGSKLPKSRLGLLHYGGGSRFITNEWGAREADALTR